MSSQPDTTPLPSDLEGLQSLITELNDNLIVQRTIYASLKGMPQESDILSGLEDCKAEFRKIQKRLCAARKAKAHYEGTYLALFTSPASHQRVDPVANLNFPNQAQKAANPKPVTQTMQPGQNGSNNGDFPGGKACTTPRQCQPRPAHAGA